MTRYQQCIKEFIDIYRDQFCLWKIKSKEYHDKKMREAAYSKLVDKLKEIEPSATKECVVKKINNIRSSYRKEVKKVKASTYEVYIPKLWYFQELSFLNDQGIPRSNFSNIGSDDDESYKTEMTNTIDNDDMSEWDGVLTDPVPQSKLSRQSKRKSTDTESLSNDPLLMVKTHLKRPTSALEDDRFELCGKHIAIKLRGLPKKQMLIAEKLINEVLFEAEMGNLTLLHGITSQRQDKIPNHHISTQTSQDSENSANFTRNETTSPKLSP